METLIVSEQAHTTDEARQISSPSLLTDHAITQDSHAQQLNMSNISSEVLKRAGYLKSREEHRTAAVSSFPHSFIKLLTCIFRPRLNMSTP
jgi:hypothetical protein